MVRFKNRAQEEVQEDLYTSTKEAKEDEENN